MAPSPIALLVASFLLGSIPFGYLLVRLRTGGDIRAAGSGNIGATNVMRTAGAKLGAITLLLDAAKGWAAVEITRHFAPVSGWTIAAALLLVILGHLYTPWLRFRGGKGVATGLGAFLALAPWALIAALGVFAITAWLWRYVSLASIAACAALPLLLLTPLGGPAATPAVEAAAVAAAALIIARHHANIRRLRAGAENKLRQRRAAGGGQAKQDAR